MLLLATFVFSQSAAATVATENWPISSAPEYGFEIKYPPSWQIGLEGMSDGIYMTIVASFFAPQAGPKKEPYFTVIFHDLSLNNTEITLEDFVQREIKHIQQGLDLGEEKFSDSSILQSNRTTLGSSNLAAHKIVYTTRILDDPNDIPSKTMTVWTGVGEKAGALTYTSPDAQIFKQYLQIIEEMLNSFKVLSNSNSPTTPVSMQATSPSGTVIHINTNGPWSGSIMDNEFRSYSVEDYGDETIPITCNEGQYGLSTYSLAIQKMEESRTLSVAVVQDGQVLKETSTSAAYGVVSLAGEC